LALIAVKNTSNNSLKLSSEAPDLFIEMTDEQGKILNVERIKKLHTEQSDSGGLIPPNGSLYYAIAYVPPVLGAHQRIRLAIGQTNAADEPASVLLTSNGR
jgi:hypothetical protein